MWKQKVLVLDEPGMLGRSILGWLQHSGKANVVHANASDLKDICSQHLDTFALFARWPSLTRGIVALFPALRLIVVLGRGNSNSDIPDYARERGIRVTNAVRAYAMITLGRTRAFVKRRQPMLRASVTARNIVRKAAWPFPVLHKHYQPNLRAIGLDITEVCNLRCDNCEASCSQARSKKRMSVQQIERFVRESLDLKWEWNKIEMRGGEPTLHPELSDIVDVLKKYKDVYPNVSVCLLSNGHGKKVRDVIARMPAWVVRLGVAKDEDHTEPLAFSSYNVAPVDLWQFRLFADFTKGCTRTAACNIGLSRYGYYPCSPGAAVDRVFGFDVGLKQLCNVNEPKLRAQMNVLCRYCGHFKEPNEAVLEGKISSSWKDAYEKYVRNKPRLSEY